MSVHLYLFGPPRLAQGEGWATLAFERRSQLVAHLALRRGWAARTELAAMLWPQVSAEQANANLRKTLFRIRSLPWAQAIAVQDQALGYHGASDVAEFEAAIEQRRWADALEIAHAPLLAGFEDDASEPWSVWLRDERERLRDAWRTAARACMAQAADPASVLALSARLLADDPLDEAALRAQMLAHAQQGQPARAREAYRCYAVQLNGDTGCTPSAELQALHDRLGAEAANALPGVELPPPAGTAEHERRLVGRAAEQRTVRARLADGCRLLSLVGPGGVGKSCLARHLQADLAAHYPDGAVFVRLEDVDVPSELAPRLARELSLPLAGGGDPLQAVIAFLRARRMLLVLDNFEQLTHAAPQLQTVLDACQRVQMLVTSRVRLGLACEHLLPLDGLPCPEAEDADCLESFDAAQLFVRAAQAVDPALQPDDEAAAIVDICRLVDGLPLALEMAAAWTRVLPCAAIAAELRRGIELLTDNQPARPARHASMAAVFEQSWLRLDDAERSTWARLTVFHGGFTLEAARAVAGATLPRLAVLIDQSLLRKTGARADLHPLLRQLAASRLTEAERAATDTAHAAYYLRWLMPLQQALQIGDKQALQQVDIEFENLRAALRWACTHGPADTLQAAVLPWLRFCELRGRPLESLAMLHEAAAGIGARDARLRAFLYAAMARTEIFLERYAEGQALAERALRESRSTRDHQTRLMSFNLLGGSALEEGRMQRARRRFRQALAQAPETVDPRAAASALQNLALVETALSHHDAARMLFIQALGVQRRIGDGAGEAMCLSNLAWLELEAGQVDVAAAYLEAALVLCERQALTSTQMAVLENLTEVSVRRNDAAAVQRHGRRALELAGRMGARRTQSWLQLQFAQFAIQQRDLPAAGDALRAGVDEAIATEHAPAQLDCVLCFVDLLHARGEPVAALRLLRYATQHPATAAASRERAGRRLAEWSAAQPGAANWPPPAIDLWSLLHRIVAETPAAHGPLIESLRAA